MPIWWLSRPPNCERLSRFCRSIVQPVWGQGGDSATEITHNQLLSHAAVVKLYRDKYQELQKGEIGIMVNTFWFLPYDDTAKSVKARDRGLGFMLGWIMDPVLYGRYPETMRERVGNRLPRSSEGEAEMVKGSFDFIELNCYSGKYAISYHSPNEVSYVTDSGYNAVGDKDGIPIGEQGSNYTWYNVYPKGLRLLLQYIKLQYNDPLIYITENRIDVDRDDSVPMSEALKDYTRKKFFFDHLCCLREAIELDGVNVKGFFTWSLTDNYEWASGYLVRYGLNYVDFTDKYLWRYPKLSAQWLGSIFGRGDGTPRVREVSDH
ncbi:beta-glucosidase [Salvia divinorum]|uniref:Beta-glucosidase n=1 Tax=Salvia divinorum TaxID=28513 RepID=A0ABD1HXB5_SALDI